MCDEKLEICIDRMSATLSKSRNSKLAPNIKNCRQQKQKRHRQKSDTENFVAKDQCRRNYL